MLSDDMFTLPSSHRGVMALAIAIIFVVFTTIATFISPYEPYNAVRVGVIDSGIDNGRELVGRIAAQRSFISTTFGYTQQDNSTTDSRPLGSLHGTYVARLIVRDAPEALIVNAKVVTSTNIATPEAISAAIRWAVEEDCSVINLSIGGPLVYDSPIIDAVKWAFKRGVSVIVAAGNNGQNGVAGSSIASPADLLESVCVAAVDEQGRPYGWSGRGPLRNGIIKPDIAAYGTYFDSTGIAWGTSFAAPRVTAAAVKIISFCKNNGWRWTPGMIKAALMTGAQRQSAQEYEVGAGLLDLASSLQYLSYAPRRNGLPLLAWMAPGEGIYDFEKWFLNCTYRLTLSVFASDNDSWRVSYSGTGWYWATGPPSLYVNQVAYLSVQICVTGSEPSQNIRIDVNMIADGYRYMCSQICFTAYRPLARVAFDISHSKWEIDSIYGQFRQFYRLLTTMGIAVEEIREPDEMTLSRIQDFDAIVVLDPCTYSLSAWGSYNYTNIITYTSDEIMTYKTYWNRGGGLFFVCLDNASASVNAVNQLLGQFNITMNTDFVPWIRWRINGRETTEIIKMFEPHSITLNVNAIDYVGASFNYTGSVFPLAWAKVRLIDAEDHVYYVNRSVIVAAENPMGGRLVAAGSNYFVDNWGLLNMYSTGSDNTRLAAQLMMWLVRHAAGY